MWELRSLMSRPCAIPSKLPKFLPHIHFSTSISYHHIFCIYLLCKYPIPPKFAYGMSLYSIRPFIPPLSRRLLPLRPSCRSYAVQNPGNPSMEVFSHHQKWMQKERAAQNTEASRNVDYLRDEAASRLCERLLVRRLVPVTPNLHYVLQSITISQNLTCIKRISTATFLTS